MKAVHSFDVLVTAHPVAQNHIPEYWKPLLRQLWNDCLEVDSLLVPHDNHMAASVCFRHIFCVYDSYVHMYTNSFLIDFVYKCVPCETAVGCRKINIFMLKKA
jgi:hypothetical protein